ncbi:MAG TPA: hypothetical protein PLV85_18335, partial [Polyangiaceae bacterium]|nr:hypothetical protein [Polyangiaceae bacterium]
RFKIIKSNSYRGLMLLFHSLRRLDSRPGHLEMLVWLEGLEKKPASGGRAYGLPVLGVDVGKGGDGWG